MRPVLSSSASGGKAWGDGGHGQQLPSRDVVLAGLAFNVSVLTDPGMHGDP